MTKVGQGWAILWTGYRLNWESGPTRIKVWNLGLAKGTKVGQGWVRLEKECRTKLDKWTNWDQTSGSLARQSGLRWDIAGPYLDLGYITKLGP